MKTSLKKTAFSFLTLLATFSNALAAELTWIGPTNGGVFTNANWVDSTGATPSGSPPVGTGDHLIFGPDGGSTINVNRGLDVRTWTFNSSSSYTFLLTAYKVGINGSETLPSGAHLYQYGAGEVTFPTFTLTGQRIFWGAEGSGAVVFSGALPSNANGTTSAVTLEGHLHLRITGTQATPTATSSRSWRLNSANAVLEGSGILTALVENTLETNRGADGATLAAGVAGTAGTLTLQGGLNLQRATNLDFELAGAGGTHDKLAITGGTFTLRTPGTGKFVLNLTDLEGVEDHTVFGAPIILIESTQGGAVAFDFDAVSSSDFAFGELPTGWQADLSYGTNGILFDTTTGLLSVQLIPEPGSVAVAILGGAVLLLSRKGKIVNR